MITHLCSHFGDIEITADKDGLAQVSWDALTPAEDKAVRRARMLFGIFGNVREVKSGTIVLPVKPGLAAAAIGMLMRPSKERIVAVRFTSGQTTTSLAPPAQIVVPETPPAPTAPAPKPPTDPVATVIDSARETGRAQASVVVPVPYRGCPMPDFSEMREEKAASVLRQFLTPTQRSDFDRTRSFVAQGGVTGHTYLITSRWARQVEKFGILRDTDTGERICSSNESLPPSEECLSMKFVVEGQWEQEWLDKAFQH
jgi:hypothetical protein